MVLPDHVIRALNIFTPFHEGTKPKGCVSFGVSSGGYDLRLGSTFSIFNPIHSHPIDTRNFDEACLHNFIGDCCQIPANSYVLAESMEHIKMPSDVMGIAQGKSTLARMGLIVNVTPIEPGWEGKLTIEIANSSPLPVKIYAGQGICQIVMFRLESLPEKDYSKKGGLYQNQAGLTTGRLYGRTKSTW